MGRCTIAISPLTIYTKQIESPAVTCIYICECFNSLIYSNAIFFKSFINAQKIVSHIPGRSFYSVALWGNC